MTFRDTHKELLFATPATLDKGVYLNIGYTDTSVTFRNTRQICLVNYSTLLDFLIRLQHGKMLDC